MTAAPDSDEFATRNSSSFLRNFSSPTIAYAGKADVAAASLDSVARGESEESMSELVCAWCDVNCRVERVQHDEQGREIMRWTCCAYCGRTEMRLGKLGHQTPLPSAPKEPPDGLPF